MLDSEISATYIHQESVLVSLVSLSQLCDLTNGMNSSRNLQLSFLRLSQGRNQPSVLSLVWRGLNYPTNSLIKAHW